MPAVSREDCALPGAPAATYYRKRMADRRIPAGKHGALAVIQRANSDLRCLVTPAVRMVDSSLVWGPRRCQGAGGDNGAGASQVKVSDRDRIVAGVIFFVSVYSPDAIHLRSTRRL